MPFDWPQLYPLGAMGLARAIAAGRLSAREALEAHARRMEETSSRLNAVVFSRLDEARDEAAGADERQARGEPLGPLHGVPITVKDSLFVAGTPSTAGLPARAGHRAETDAPLVKRLRQAGAVVLAKTNVPQLLLSLETDNPLFGRARNPWRLERSPGGSSGGEAAAVSAGVSALGIGTDLGGSIRVPAHACGICGLMPTARRLSLVGTLDAVLASGQGALVAQPGPLARHVEDLVLALEVLAAPGQEARDTVVPAAPFPAETAVRVEGLRVGFFTDDGWFPASAACRRAVEVAARALAARGARVEELRPPDVSEAMRVCFGLLSAAGTDWTKPFLDGGAVNPDLLELVRTGRLPHRVARALAFLLDLAGQPRRGAMLRHLGRRSAREDRALRAARDRYHDRFLADEGPGRFDVWLSPPSPTPALVPGASRHLVGAASYSLLYALLGFPAGVVPVTRVKPEEQSGRSASRDPLERTAREVDAGSAGLPVGVQVAARAWREDIVLSVLTALEEDLRAREDYPRRPPL
jgi:fatty acid amide hydrolase